MKVSYSCIAKGVNLLGRDAVSLGVSQDPKIP